MAVVIYREKVDARRWLAVLVGFAGVLFIVLPAQPRSTHGQSSLWCCGCQLVRDVLTYNSSGNSNYGARLQKHGCTHTGRGWARHLWRVAAAQYFRVPAVARRGRLLWSCHIFIALAFRRGEISVVTPFRYTSLLWAGTSGYVGFGEIPNTWSLAGAALSLRAAFTCRIVMRSSRESSGMPRRHRDGDGPSARSKSAARIQPLEFPFYEGKFTERSLSSFSEALRSLKSIGHR